MATRLSLNDIRDMLSASSDAEAEVLLNTLEGDDRAGVARLADATRRKLVNKRAEAQRIEAMFEFDRSHIASANGYVLGIDEVGRGPLAGPLAAGGVVLDLSCPIDGINDSKKLTARTRGESSRRILSSCIACSVRYIDPETIDEIGMSASLKLAFSSLIEDIESMGIGIDVVLLDGNPMRIDDREVNVVKGDQKSASIAAASIVAKVSRDILMDVMDIAYPGYGFASNKGYGTKEHIEAIREKGETEIHRRSFCTSFAQESLF